MTDLAAVVDDHQGRATLLTRWLMTVTAAPGHVIMSTKVGGFSGTTLDTDDLERSTQTLLAASNISDTYLRATTTSRPFNGKRGGAEDTEAVFGLWADLDHAMGVHKPPADGLPLPADIDECLAIISPLPDPTIVINSGGGLQVWWLLDRPVRVADRPDLEDVVEAWGHLMVDLGHQSGRHVDMVGDLARILRPPGTLNHKWADRRDGHPVPVTVLDTTGTRYTLDQLAALTAPLAAEPTTTKSAQVAGDHDDIAAWEADNDWADILKPHGWTLHRTLGGGVREWTRPGADRDTTPRSAVTDFAGKPTMVVHSAAAGLPSGGKQALTKFRVYAHLNHHGNRTAASEAIRRSHGTPIPNVTVLPDPVAVDEEEAFWAAHPTLAHIRTFARARLTSPWAVLGIVLTRIVVCQPPHYVLPAIIGGFASLNLFLAIVAQSGGGKGAADAAGKDALVYPEEIHTSGIGSGEGILHQYVAWRPANKKENIPAGIEQHRDRVLFTAAEVDTLAALHARQASTTLSESRKMWMGEELSFAYVDPTKALKVRSHAYRAGLVVGVQPGRAGVILDDSDGGTPQRFLWLPGSDPDIPDVEPNEPEPVTWIRPVAHSHRVDGKVVLRVCDQAIDTIKDAHRRRNRGDGEALDGHALLCRLKVAAALGLLREELGVSEESWRLSETVMRMSDHTRGTVVNHLRQVRAKANEAQGAAYAQREVMKEDAVAEAAVRRVCGAVMRGLQGGALAHAELRRKLASRDRNLFEEAVVRLVEAGQIAVREEGHVRVYATNP